MQVMADIFKSEKVLLSSAFLPQNDQYMCRTLAELGALYTFNMESGVTALVCTHLRTEKAAWAAKNGIPIVTADWVYASKALWGK